MRFLKGVEFMKMVFEVFLVLLLSFVGSYLFCNITGLREVPETTLVTAISLMLFGSAYAYKL